jgi:hypothetical protein
MKNLDNKEWKKIRNMDLKKLKNINICMRKIIYYEKLLCLVFIIQDKINKRS